MKLLKIVTAKGECVWINADKILYITEKKDALRIYFSDGFYCDAVEIIETTLRDFLHQETEN